MGIVRKQGDGGRKVTSGGNSHEMRTNPHEMRQAVRPNEESRWFSPSPYPLFAERAGAERGEVKKLHLRSKRAA